MRARVGLGNSVESALTSVLDFLPRFVAFILVLVIGYFIAKALATLTNKILERVGFERAVARGGIAEAMAKGRHDASDIIAKIVYYAILLFALQMAFGIFPDNPVSELLTGIIVFLPKIFVAIIILVVGSAVAMAVKDLIQGSLGWLSYGSLLGTIASVFIMFVTIIAALNQVEIATTVTTPILIAILATVGGVIVVGVGGGLIGPMRERWGGWLSSLENETGRARSETAFRRARGSSNGDDARSDPTRTDDTTHDTATTPVDVTDTTTGVYDQYSSDQIGSGQTHR